jgi:hypothetical protein
MDLISEEKKLHYSVEALHSEVRNATEGWRHSCGMSFLAGVEASGAGFEIRYASKIAVKWLSN